MSKITIPAEWARSTNSLITTEWLYCSVPVNPILLATVMFDEATQSWASMLSADIGGRNVYHLKTKEEAKNYTERRLGAVVESEVK